MKVNRSSAAAGSAAGGPAPSSLMELVTPLIITFNEAPNLERTLRRLAWAKRIVVVDSFSTDATIDMLKAYPQVEIFQRRFDSFAGQCNYGLGKIESEWVLSIDADYVLTGGLIEEMRSLRADTREDAYTARFRYCVWGRPLRGTLYPPRRVLYRRAKASYADDGHAHHVRVSGRCAQLSSYIDHDDRKPLARWTASQAKYVEDEAGKLSGVAAAELGLNDRLRKRKTLAPFLVLLYCLVLRRVALDGWPGWYYAFQRTLAEMLLAFYLIGTENLSAREDIVRWVREEDARAAAESERLLNAPSPGPGLKDRVRRLKIAAPLLAVPYALLVKGGLLSGWRGWHEAYRRTLRELLLSIHLIESEHIVGGELKVGERAVAS
jgi:glycosyltransferase involved in cell wall biosynthesis